MSVKKQPNGSFRAYVNRVIDGKRKPLTRCFKSEKEAFKWEGRMRNDETIVSRSLKFKDIFVEYIDSKAGSIEESSLDAIRYKTKHFMDSLKEKKIEIITPVTLNKWRTEIVETEYSIKYKNEIILLLKSICRFTAETYYMRDPSLKIKLLKKVFDGDDENDEEYNIINPEDFGIIYDAMPEVADWERYFKAFAINAWSTGMRRGELKGLQWKNNNERAQIYSIRKAVTGKIKKDRSALTNTKTKTSVRNINYDDYCASETARLLAFCKDVYGFNENWFMFGGIKPICNTMIQNRFRNALIDSGLYIIRCEHCHTPVDTKVVCLKYKTKFKCPVKTCKQISNFTLPHHIHELRHSHATILLERGVPISAVSARLGHSSITQTTKTYLHSSKNAVNAMILELPNIHAKKSVGNNLGNNSEQTKEKAPC